MGLSYTAVTPRASLQSDANKESNHPNIILRDMRDERNDVKSQQEGESSRQGRARALH